VFKKFFVFKPALNFNLLHLRLKIVRLIVIRHSNAEIDFVASCSQIVWHTQPTSMSGLAERSQPHRPNAACCSALSLFNCFFYWYADGAVRCGAYIANRVFQSNMTAYKCATRAGLEALCATPL